MNETPRVVHLITERKLWYYVDDYVTAEEAAEPQIPWDHCNPADAAELAALLREMTEEQIIEAEAQADAIIS